MPLNIDIDNLTLDILAARLKNTVSPLDILKWLGNFEKSEIKIAIDFLSNMTVYSTFEIEEILNQNFQTLFSNLDKDATVIVHPVGKFGKSGSLISYFFQKTDFYRLNKPRISLVATLDSLKILKDKKFILVLLDDFVGTGKTIEDYYLSNVKPQSDKIDKCFFTGIAGIRKGIDRIRPIFSKIILPKSNIFLKAFANEASYFGYRKFHNHRAVAFKYGSLLTTPKKLKNGTLKSIHALGYENSQSLVAFAYGSPNNTLPIIYSNGNDKIKWVPLIPRFSKDKINTAKEFRKNISHELSILKEFGNELIQDNFFSLKIKKGNKTFTSVNHIDFSVYSIIKLSREGFTPINICQKLGILDSDYQSYLDIGKKRGLFSEANKLTFLGLELFQEAKKCISRRKKSIDYENSDPYKIRKIEYIPKSFNGRS